MTGYQIAERIRINEEIAAWNLDNLNPWSDHYKPALADRQVAMVMVQYARKRIAELRKMQDG